MTIGMSSQDGRRDGEENGTEPTAQFDAFRARRADERAQQEAESEYVFPEEYAAAPGAVLPPEQPPGPPMPPYGGGYGPDPAAPGGTPGTLKRRWRSAAIFGGAVLVAAALGLGLWSAFDSAGASPGETASGTPATNTATGTPAGTDGRRTISLLTFRVTIRSVGTDSFTGTVIANGANVTVELTPKTRFGTKAHPFSRTGLSSGETVIVRGRRTGADTVTATVVAADTAASAKPGG